MGDGQRYLRQSVLPEVGPQGQEKLGRARVLVVGAGGLGSPVMQYLAAAGVGAITILDHDRLALTNLHRQVIYTTADVGRLKVEAAAERLSALNPEVHIAPVARRLSSAFAEELVRQHDVVVDAADTIAATYALSDACLKHDKPLISATVVSLSGYVGRFCAGNPSYRALFPQMPENAGSCDTLGVLGSAVGVMGSLQAHMVLQEILGFGTRGARLVTVDFRNLAIGGFDFSDAREPEEAPLPLVAPEDFTPSDVIVELRDADEAPELPAAHARRLLPAEVAGAELPTDRRVVLCCRTGLRSSKAAGALREKGYADLAIAALG